MINEQQAHKYCKDDISKIENYNKAIADTTQTWDLHHRTEIWWNCSVKELIENECYYHRKACELIFLTKSEHHRIHCDGEINPFYGKHHTEEANEKNRLAHLNKYDGKHNPMYGKTSAMKGKHHSTEARQKISDSKKGTHPSEETRKKLSDARRAYLARIGGMNSDTHRMDKAAT